jgi:hypothetical protein
MTIKNEFLLEKHQLIQQKKLSKGNVTNTIIQQAVENQSNIQDINVRNAMLSYA